MNKISTILNILFLMLITVFSLKAQSLTLIPHPLDGSGITVSVNPIVFNNNLYFSYVHSFTNKKHLAKWDGTNITIIPNPDNGSGFDTTSAPIIFNGNLYFGYFNINGHRKLAKFDGTTISLVKGKANFYEYFRNAIVFNNELYIRYNDGTDVVLAKYNGTDSNITKLIFHTYGDYEGSPIIYNNKLFLRWKRTHTSGIKYDLVWYNGTDSLISGTVLNSNITHSGFLGQPIVFNNDLYFQYKGTGNTQLARYNGTGTNITSFISNANALDFGYWDSPIVFNSELYFRYYDTTLIYKLGKYSGTGTTVTVINNIQNNHYGHQGYPFIFGNDLFFEYSTSAVNGVGSIGKYNGTGTSISLIPNLPNKEYRGRSNVVHNGNLYLTYALQNSPYTTQLARYNGNAIIPYVNPETTGGLSGNLIIFNNNLYVVYSTPAGGRQLAYLDNLAAPLSMNVNLIGKKIEDKDELSWEVIDENDIHNYEVQELQNGDFKTIATVDNEKKSIYKYLNSTPLSGHYRLLTKELNGTLNYSNQIVLKRSNENSVGIYPNPTSNIINFNLFFNKNEVISFKIFDATGKIVYQNTYSVAKGYSSKTIDVATLPVGNYTINLSNGNNWQKNIPLNKIN